MKRTNVKWIGSIPESWNLERLQWHLLEIKENNDPIHTSRILSLTNKLGVIPYEEKGDHGNKAKENLNEYKLAYPGTIVANAMNILIGSVGICDYFGCVSPVYYVFKPKDNSNLRFINYVFQTSEFQKELRRYANGILEIRLRISSADILKRQIAFPKMDVQEKIVSFLDEKMDQIDSLIDIENQQIEELRNYKQSTITETVKKGLYNNSQMKSSGVNWIGDINEEYRIIPLKYLLAEQMMYGANESGHSEKTQNCYRYIRITDIDDNGILKDTDDNQYLLDEVGLPYRLEEGDVLFARSGGTVGKTFIYQNSYGRCAFAGYLIKGKSNKTKLLPEYLYLYTQSSIYELWKQQIFIQATIQNIGANKYSMLPVVCGSIEEQNKIVDYVRKKCSEIDRLIVLKQNKIDKLNEYKKSLIYEYVTGKKEVANG